MSNKVAVSPNRLVSKTRNAILRIKKCSPELRTVLRQRCLERIHNDRLKILNTFRKIKIQDSFRNAFGNILCEEWKNIESDDLIELPSEDLSSNLPSAEFNLDDELLLEEILEKELLLEHENWLVKQYEELLSEDFHNSNEIVCPLCFSGFLEIKEFQDLKRTYCTNCSSSFVFEKSLFDLQSVINECLASHDKQCDNNPSFVNVPKNENENNLCVICHKCSYLNIIV